MSYALLADLKLALKITDAVDDGLLQAALDATDEAIDDHCNRTFVASAVASIRYFDIVGGRIEVDDIWTTEGLIVSIGGSVIPPQVDYVSAGYVIGPRNAPALGEPFTEIEYGGPGPYGWAGLIFHGSTAQAAVTAKWGYSQFTPPSVHQAEIIQASRVFSRKNSPYGVAGSPDMGNELRLLAKVDPDVAVLLAGKVRY